MVSGGLEEKVEAGAPAVVDTKTPKLDLGKMPGLKQKEAREWNTKNIGQRLVVDAGCAAAAGSMVAPVVSMIDR